MGSSDVLCLYTIHLPKALPLAALLKVTLKGKSEVD